MIIELLIFHSYHDYSHLISKCIVMQEEPVNCYYGQCLSIVTACDVQSKWRVVSAQT